MKYIGQNLSVVFTKIKELMNSHNTSSSAHSALLKSKFDSWVILNNPTNAEIVNAIKATYEKGVGDVLVHESSGGVAKLFFRPSVSTITVPALGEPVETLKETKGIYITTSGEQGQYIASHTDGTLTLTPALNDAIRYASQSLTDAQKQQARENIDAYTKPSDGIPKSDLSTDVQKTLGNADGIIETGVGLIRYIKMVDADSTGSGIVVPDNSDETYYTIKEYINSGYTVILLYKGVPYSLNYTKLVNNSISLYYFHAIMSSDAKSTVDTASEIKTVVAGNSLRFKVTTKPLYTSATVTNNTLVIHSGATVSNNTLVMG